MSFLTDLFNQTPVVQGGVTLMAAGWIGYQLREIPGRVTDFVQSWTTRTIQIRENNPLYDSWLAMMTEHAVRPGGPRTVEVQAGAGDDYESGGGAVFRAGTEPFWAYVLGKWCRVHLYREQPSAGSQGLTMRFILSITVVGARRRHLEMLLTEAKRRANVHERRQRVDMADKYGSRNSIFIPRRERHTLCLPTGVFESVEGRARDFLASKEQYDRVGIPWRMGIMLYGPPGTGKTSFAHVLASELGLRLSVIPLADIRSDDELVSAFQNVDSGSILLLEDIDCAFRKRAADAATGITFSGLLNCIDGMLAPQNGRILIMSTNHVDQLDPALIRPGRIDLRVEIGRLTRDAATDYVDRLFPHIATRHDLVNEIMATSNPTPAELLNRIMREAWHKPGPRPAGVASASADHAPTTPTSHNTHSTPPLQEIPS